MRASWTEGEEEKEEKKERRAEGNVNEKRKGKGRLIHFFYDSRGKELDVRYQSKTFFLFFF